VQDHYLAKDVAQKVVDGSWALNEALGYDMNSVEFAIKDGVPYAIDFTNPAPDMDYWSITEHYFKIVVEEMAKFTVKCVRENRKPRLDRYQFGDFLPGGPRHGEAGPVGKALAKGDIAAAIAASNKSVKFG
jgi:hypothetical protein